MKIKTKKQLNLPQLIEYIWENDIEEETFYNLYKTSVVYIDNDNTIHVQHRNKETNVYEVEVEEEITEDTEFENLIEILDGSPNCLWERASVEDWKDEESKEFHAYIDGEFKLIWRDGRLIE